MTGAIVIANASQASHARGARRRRHHASTPRATPHAAGTTYRAATSPPGAGSEWSGDRSSGKSVFHG
ncbi:MAG: hypothetical protein IPJ77_00585 [Planctomycetes bacterium]|nr:hypothetical protein [Planctomycetota bacterium]